MSFTTQTRITDPRFPKAPAFGVESPQHQAEVADYLRRKAALQQNLGETTSALMTITEHDQPSHPSTHHEQR